MNKGHAHDVRAADSRDPIVSASSGLVQTLWSLDDIVALIDAAASAAKLRTPYKTKARLAAIGVDDSE